MMIRGLFACAMAMFALVLVVNTNAQGDKDKEKDKEKKLTVKQIMAKAHGKDGLRAKVIKGEASNEEKKALIDMYTALAALDCPKGDKDSWKEKTKAVVNLAKSDDVAMLKKIDCKGCHMAHK